jgi:glycosyltransferase involved in cell wall biosynthesis
MRILVEASAAFDQTAGIGRYSRNVLNSVLPMLPDWDWRLVHAPARPTSATSRNAWIPPPGAKIVRLPFSRRRADQLWFRARVPLDVRLFAGPVDLLYSPDFTAPPAIGVPRVVTVHDLAFLTHPDQTTPALRSYLSAVVPREVARAELVAVVSEATRHDVVELLAVPADRVVVIRNGVEERFFNPSRLTSQDREALGIPERYLLMVGTIEPRKNHLNVLRAIDRMPSTDRLPLVIAGRPGWGYEHALAVARRMEAVGLVHVIDHVPEAILPSLYAGAEAVLYPSWTEGFGLPILEAFAAGTPVITGTAPALREVGGDLATCVDPGDLDAIANAIAAHVAGTNAMSNAAQRIGRARSFTWEEPARRLSTVLADLDRRA